MIAALVALVSIVIVATSTRLICWRYRAQNRERPDAKANPQTQKQSGPDRPPDTQPVAVEPEPPQSVDSEDRTTQEPKECGNCVCVSTCIQGAALIGLAIYCYFTYGNWQEAQKQSVKAKESIDASTQALHTTQRPWVYASDVEVTKIYPINIANPDGHFDVDVAVSLHNSGTSVAIKGATLAYLYPGYGKGGSMTFAAAPMAGVTDATLVAPWGTSGISNTNEGEIFEKECREVD